MRFRGFSAWYGLIVVFCGVFLALAFSYVSRAADTGPDWVRGNISFEVADRPAWKDGDPFDNYGEKEWVTATEKTGYSWNIQDTPVSAYAVQTAAGAVSSRGFLPIGDSRWQLLDSRGISDTFTYNPATSGMTVATNTSGYSGLPDLYYVNDWRLYFGNFSNDGLGNVVRSRTGKVDKTLTLPNGAAVKTDGYGGGVHYSKNGQWLVVNTGNGIARVEVSTFKAIYFAPAYSAGSGASTSVSNSGRFAAVMTGYNALSLYDLAECEAEKPDYSQRNCAKRSLLESMKTEYKKTLPATSSLGDLRPQHVSFLNESTLQVIASAMVDQKYKNVTIKLHVDPGPQTTRYIALGDSFSSGEGAGNYYEATNFYTDENNFNLCHQSRISYSDLLNKWLAPDWYDSVACSGAKMNDVVYTQGEESDYVKFGSSENGPQARDPAEDDAFLSTVKENLRPGYIPQLSLLQANPATVSTISIGGNDIGFGAIVTKCVTNADCYNTESERRTLASTIDQKIPLLANTFSVLKRNMSGFDPHLYVIGYPKIFNENTGCNGYMTQSERQFANHLVDYLNAAIKIAAMQAAAQYIDVSDAFIDYQAEQDFRLCGNGPQAVNGLIVDVKNASDTQKLQQYFASSFHPNQLGHVLLAKRVRAYTNDFARIMPESSSISKVPEDTIYKTFVGVSRSQEGEVLTSIMDGVTMAILDNKNPIGFTLNLGSSVLPSITGSVTVEWHSTPTGLGTLPISKEGIISGSFPMPPNTTPGVHELHVLYTDIAKQKHDFIKYFYVIGSLSDFDGDGIPNSQEQCAIGGTMGVDYDEDDIDDACDPDIADKPITPELPAPPLDPVDLPTVPADPPLPPESPVVIVSGNEETEQAVVIASPDKSDNTGTPSNPSRVTIVPPSQADTIAPPQVLGNQPQPPSDQTVAIVPTIKLDSQSTSVPQPSKASDNTLTFIFGIVVVPGAVAAAWFLNRKRFGKL